MKKLAQGAIGTGSGTLAYTVPTGFKTDIMDINIANTTASPISCALHLVPVGVAVGTSNILFPTFYVPGNTIIQWTGSQTLNAGDFIRAIGSGAGLTMNITGIEYR